jgi:hypothetical protein
LTIPPFPPHLTISTSRCRCLPNSPGASMFRWNNGKTSKETNLDGVIHLPPYFFWGWVVSIPNMGFDWPKTCSLSAWMYSSLT